MFRKKRRNKIVDIKEGVMKIKDFIKKNKITQIIQMIVEEDLWSSLLSLRSEI